MCPSGRTRASGNVLEIDETDVIATKDVIDETINENKNKESSMKETFVPNLLFPQGGNTSSRCRYG